MCSKISCVLALKGSETSDCSHVHYNLLPPNGLSVTACLSLQPDSMVAVFAIEGFDLSYTGLGMNKQNPREIGINNVDSNMFTQLR